MSVHNAARLPTVCLVLRGRTCAVTRHKQKVIKLVFFLKGHSRTEESYSFKRTLPPARQVTRSRNKRERGRREVKKPQAHVQITFSAFTWYRTLQGEDVRAFFPVYVAPQAQLRDNLESLFAQAYAVLCVDAHVSHVTPWSPAQCVREVDFTPCERDLAAAAR